MVAPISTTWTVTSGSLSTLDRYSAYGISEPSIHVADPVINNDYEFLFDFVNIAVHPTSMWREISLDGSLGVTITAKGSNDGETWDAITVGNSESEVTGEPFQEAVFRWSAPLTTTKFYRYLKMVFTINSYTFSGTLNLKFQTVNFGYDSYRPWSEDGQGGVGPGGDGGGANDPGGENDPSTHEGFAMSDLSVYAGDMVLGWIKGTQMETPPEHIYVALFDGDPDDPDTPGNELTGTGGLSRKEVTFSDVVSRYMLNTNKVEFGIPDDTVTVACFALYDAVSGGNRLTKKMLSAPATFDDATMILFQPGKLPVYY